MKYMIIEVGESEYPLLFSEDLFHVDFANLFKNRIVSAGFVTGGKDGKLECYGMSDGLQIWSRPMRDSEIINLELTPYDWHKLLFEPKKLRSAAGAS